MPYASNARLPGGARLHLPRPAQTIYRELENQIFFC